MDRIFWQKLTWGQQLGNIGAEIARAGHWQATNNLATTRDCLLRAFELFDLSLDDKRWGIAELRELAIFREVVADWYSGEKQYNVPTQMLEEYCTQFVLREHYLKIK